MSRREGPTDRDEQIRAHLPLVKRIAYHLMSRLPASVEVDDLIQAGLIGLLDAVERFDDSHGAHFETYATQRIRGGMLDELREGDWASRSVRKAARQIEEAVHHLEQHLQRPPSESEIAEQMGLPINDYFEVLSETRGAQLIYYEDLYESRDEDFLERYIDASDEPFEIIAGSSFRKALAQAIGVLPEREQLLMSLYYEHDMNFKEIGAVLDVTESRVSQLHTQAVSRLRARLKAWGE